MPISAIIFDLDGVIVSTNLLHKVALTESIMRSTDIDVSAYIDISEKSMLSTKQKLKKIQDILKFDNFVYDDILRNKDIIFLEKLKSLRADANVIDCLTDIKRLGIPTAIASNSRLNNIHAVLDTTGLRKYFDVIVSGEDVMQPKPAPDILYEVYNRLNLSCNERSNTFFVEDTEEGAAAGHSSPSTVIMVNSPLDLCIELFQDRI